MTAKLDGLKAIQEAADRLRDDTDMRRKLLTFVDYWGLDAYTPPPDVESNVRDLVLAFPLRLAPGRSDMTDDLLARLDDYEACSLRPYVVKEAAAEIRRLTKHVTILHDVADQRNKIILERQARIAKLEAVLQDARSHLWVAEAYLELRGAGGPFSSMANRITAALSTGDQT